MTHSKNIRKRSAFIARLFVAAALLLSAGFQQAYAQTVDVRGTVVSSTDGLPVIGASVVEKGTTNGAVAANDGTYQIRVRRGATLVVSAIGYGVQKKKLVTGSTVQVKGDDVAKLNTVDVLGALQSQSPGVSIIQNNGFLGAGFKVDNWDDKGLVPYVTKDGKMWAGYDNPKSIGLKAEKILSMGMKGLMFWDYDADDSAGTLRNAVWNSVMK